MLVLITLYMLLVGVLFIISRRSVPLSANSYRSLAILLLGLTALLALAFSYTSQQVGSTEPCERLAHASWPWFALTGYIALGTLACLLLQAFHRLGAYTYALLIIYPLALAPFWVKLQCTGHSPSRLVDTLQGLLLIGTFPIYAILWGILGLCALFFIWKHKPDLRLASLSLFALFALLQQHASDWLRLIMTS